MEQFIVCVLIKQLLQLVATAEPTRAAHPLTPALVMAVEWLLEQEYPSKIQNSFNSIQQVFMELDAS
jgi:hypothetical protein